MIARIFVDETPCTLRATAYVVLPGDEQIPVELELAQGRFGELVLRFGVEPVQRALDDRGVDAP